MFILLLTLIPVLMTLYIIKRTVFLAPISNIQKILFSAFLLLFSQSMNFFFIFPKTTGSMMIFGICFSFILFLFLICLMAHFLGGVFGLFVPINALIITALFLSFLSVFLAIRQPRITHLSWHLGLPQKVKIVQLSDLHIGSGFTKKWLEKVTQKVNMLEPDVVLLTGDLIDGTPEKLQEEISPLTQIKAPILMSYGNHEYYYHLRKWIPVFEKMGIFLLDNNAISMKGLSIGGVGMPSAEKFGFPQPDLEKTFKQVPQNQPRILLSHYPQLFHQAQQHKIFLQLSGHTHGGQLFFPLTLLTRFANQGYIKGLYHQGDSWLYVSSGTALWGGAPFRLGTLPEITEIEID